MLVCGYGPLPWIEKLLQTLIEDYRKRSRDLILVPYLVFRRGMRDESQITQIVMRWPDKNAQNLEGLTPLGVNMKKKQGPESMK
ncbi:MAG TPA: hypothetical protein VKA87_06095 [Nitrososphaeraceae archaeon]|nr:hypothetical protein [Nitrososphaeraceae archaeon]